MKNTILRTLGYVGAGLALFACGDTATVSSEIDEMVLGQSAYSLQRACLSESADLYSDCTGKESSDRKCEETLNRTRTRCGVTDADRENPNIRPSRDEDVSDAQDDRVRPRPDREEEDVDRPRRDREEAPVRPTVEREEEEENVRPRTEREEEENADRPRRDREEAPVRPTPEREEEEEPVRERPQSCEAACQAHAHEVFLDCVDSGRNAQDCRAYAADLIDICIEDRCAEPEVDPEIQPVPLTCEQRCQNHGREVYAECVDSGRRNVTCRAYAGRIIQSCIENRCAEDEAETESEVEQNTCAHRARAVFQHCTEQGGGPDRCRHIARRAHQACLDAQQADEDADVAPRPVPTTINKCKHRAKTLYAQCLENGGSRLRCSALAQRALRACKGAHQSDVEIIDAEDSNEEDTSDSDVEEGDADVEHACSERARAHYERCIESREDSRACGGQARAAYERCAGMQSDDESAEAANDSDVDLNRACGTRARHLYASCIEDGGDPRRCGTLAHRALDACLSDAQN